MKNKQNYLFVVFTVSLVAVMGSLFFSEVLKYEPCKMCWYQRLFMYPIVLISAYGLLMKEYKIKILIMVMSFVGFILSSIHYSMQKFGMFSDTSKACGLIPCTNIYIDWFGFITIPFLAGTAFVIIFAVSLIGIKRTK